MDTLYTNTLLVELLQTGCTRSQSEKDLMLSNLKKKTYQPSIDTSGHLPVAATCNTGTLSYNAWLSGNLESQ